MCKRFQMMRVYDVFLITFITLIATTGLFISFLFMMTESGYWASVKEKRPLERDVVKFSEENPNRRPYNHNRSDPLNTTKQLFASRVFEKNHHLERSSPVVLFWNYKPRIGYGVDFTKRFCNVTCEFTNDRTRFTESAAIIVHAYAGTGIDHIDVLPSRAPWQRVVLFLRESPVHTKSLKSFAREINWTMSYRRDSDFFVPYGAMTVTGVTRTLKENFAKRKKKLAIWLVSNCNTTSRRENYMRRLRRYMTVDVFGHCSTEKCNDSCLSMAKDYKFYMAFENSFCEDYLTEKSWRTLKLGIVPVVLGSADYSSLLPPGSYVNAADFRSPKLLANYLKAVDADDRMYNKFFEWKRRYRVASHPRAPSVCALCTRLTHNATEPRTFYEDIDNWWRIGKCDDVSEKYPALSKYFL